eukprot:362761_1
MLSDAVHVDDSEDEILLSKPSNFNELKNRFVEHNNVLQYTKKIGIYWIVINLIEWFFFCCRWYVWILYARSLGEYHQTYIAFAIYSVYVIQALSNLFWGWMADKYSYDIIGIILSFFVVIGLIIESFASVYLMLFIGSIIINSFRINLSVAFLTQYFPNHYAVKYQSFRFAGVAVINLTGPIIGGVFAQYFTLKSPFYISTCCAFIVCLILIIIIRGSQQNIHKQQIKMRSFYDILESNHNQINIVNIISDNKYDNLYDTNYQFPVATKKYIMQQNKQKHRNKQITPNKYNICSQIKRNLPELNKTEWITLINIIIANSTMQSTESIFATYFVVLCIDLFNLKLIESTLMVCGMTFLYVIASVITPSLVKKFKKEGDDKYNLEFVSLIVMGFFFIGWNISCKYFLYFIGSTWIWMICTVSGFCVGVVNMLSEIILLGIQPKHHSGKISGYKTFSRHLARAFASLIVGLLWNVDKYWFFYGQALMISVATISTIIAFYANKNTINSDINMMSRYL